MLEDVPFARYGREFSDLEVIARLKRILRSGKVEDPEALQCLRNVIKHYEEKADA